MGLRIYLVIPIILCMMVAIAVSFFLVPQEHELALIRFRNKEYEEALNRFERLWQQGNRTVSVVVPLSRLYLQHSAVERAVEIMEDFVAAHPKNLEARVQLGQYYQYAQRTGDYIHNLEVVSALQPSEESLRELSASYNFEGEYLKQIEVLSTLVQLFPKRQKDFVDLAYLQASQGLYDDALGTLVSFEEKHADAVDDDIVELLINLAFDANERDLAYQRARDWLRKRNDPKVVTQLVALFHGRQEILKAASLLEDFEHFIESSPELLKQSVEIDIELGNKERAFSRLSRLHSSKSLPDRLVPLMIQLALDRSETGLALELGQGTEFDQLDRWLQLGLVEVALNEVRIPFLRHVTRKGDRDLFENRPVLGARVALRLGNPGSARTWMQTAQALPDLALSDRVDLANIYIDQGEKETALRILRDASGKFHLPGETLLQMAHLYLATGKSSDGVTFFERIQSQSAPEEATQAWALLAASLGKEREVRSWLEGQSASLPVDYLTDLYYVSSDIGLSDLALLCARELYRYSSSRQHTMFLATTSLEAKLLTDALKLARQLVPGKAEEEALYLSALAESWKNGDPVEEELISYWLRRVENLPKGDPLFEEAAYTLRDLGADQEALDVLEELAFTNPEQWLHAFAESARQASELLRLEEFLELQLARNDLPEKTKEECLYLLTQAGRPEVVFPHLERAANLSQDWFFFYQDYLQKLGLEDRLHHFWKLQSERPDIDPGQRRAIAFQLLEAGYKREAEGAFWHLATLAPANSPDVNQLLYLWGPRPAVECLEWIERRTREAESDIEKADWLRHLSNVNQYARVVQVVEKQNLMEGEVSFELVQAYVRALGQLREEQKLKQVLMDQINQHLAVDRMRALAHLAIECSREDLAVRAYSKLLDTKPEDPEAHKIVGRYAFFQGSRKVAKKHLEKTLQIQPEDYEVLFYLGEIERAERDLEAAMGFHREALAVLEEKPSKTNEERLLKAKLLNRLGETEKSLELFRKLIRQNPKDKYLRGDFASVLIENKRYKEAEAVLGFEKNDG